VDVKRGQVISEVSVTGKVKPLKSIDLAFEQSGRLSRMLVSVGDEVYQGQSLAVLDNAGIYAQLAQAKANVKAQQAKLDELKRGARTEDLSAKTSELKKAQEDLKGYLDDVVNVLNDAYSKSDDAVRIKTGNLFLANILMYLFILGIILSPSGTPKAPPGQKSFCISTTKRAFLNLVFFISQNLSFVNTN